MSRFNFGLSRFLPLLVCSAFMFMEVHADARGTEVSGFRLDETGSILDKASYVAHQREIGVDSSSMDRNVTKASAALDPLDAYWESAGSLTFPGVTGGYYQWPVAVEFEGKLVVGGGFTFAGGTNVNHIAAWDGSTWTPLGDGLDGYVYSLTVHDGRLVAAGSFDHSGSQFVGSIAVWDGSSWLSSFPSIDGTPDYLLSVGNLLYVTLRDSTPYVSRVVVWNGSVWDTLGGDFDNYLNSLVLFEGKVTVAGDFTMVGGTSANSIATWDGSAWHPLGSGVSGNVFALCPFSGKLIAGGYFEEAGGGPTHALAEWDGTTWTAKDSGLGTSGFVRALAVHGGELFAGAKYEGKLSVVKWNGSAWGSVSSGYFRNSYAFIYGMTKWSGRLVVLGSFSDPGNQVALWDGTTWSAAGDGFLEYAGPLVQFGGRLIVAGTYGRTGALSAGPVLAWNGEDWEDLESGINGKVQAMFRYGDKLIVSGAFDSAGGIAANHIAAWNGVTWSALGSGLDSAAVAFAVYGNKLIVGGKFTSAGGESRPYLAAWDDQSWSSLDDSPNGAINVLSVYNGALIAAGNFTAIGSEQIEWIASWNGQAWTGVDSDIDGPFVRALQVYNGELIALGAHSLASAWNGQSWRPITGAGGFLQDANCAVVHAGQLIVGGDHSSGHYIFKWDGKTWSTLGSGVTGRVWSFASTDSALFLSGGFAYAGSVMRPYVASWHVSSGCCTGSVGNIDQSIAEPPDLTDLSLLVAYLTQTPRPLLTCIQEANLDLSTTGAWPYIDLSDLSMMVSYLTTSPRPPLLSCP